jgi:hypothetical protein
MRKELIELESELRISEDVEVKCQALQLLLNKKITSFHFPSDLSKSDHHAVATALWRHLVAERPSDLHTIVCKSCRYDEEETSWDVRPFFSQMLPAFSQSGGRSAHGILVL